MFFVLKPIVPIYNYCVCCCMCYAQCLSPSQCAQLAQMASVELFQALYFKQQRGREGGEGGGGREDVRGVVFALRDNGVMVFVPRWVWS